MRSHCSFSRFLMRGILDVLSALVSRWAGKNIHLIAGFSLRSELTVLVGFCWWKNQWFQHWFHGVEMQKLCVHMQKLRYWLGEFEEPPSCWIPSGSQQPAGWNSGWNPCVKLWLGHLWQNLCSVNQTRVFVWCCRNFSRWFAFKGLGNVRCSASAWTTRHF